MLERNILSRIIFCLNDSQQNLFRSGNYQRLLVMILLSKEVIGKYKVSLKAVIFADPFFLSISLDRWVLGRIVEGGIKEQTKRFMHNMKAVHGEVMRSSTTMPAEVIKKKEYIGMLKVGHAAMLPSSNLKREKFPSYLILLAKTSNGRVVRNGEVISQRIEIT